MTTNPRMLCLCLSALPLLAAACGGGAGTGDGDAKVVNVYNWADYIGTGVLDDFEAETGIRVNYDTYDSARVVDVKLLTGKSGYDVVVHSSRSSATLAPLGIYEKLDTDRLENLRHLDPDIMSQIDIYDSIRGYFAPYHWGTTGIAWNEDLVRERLPDVEIDSAGLVFDPTNAAKLADCGISLLDDPGDVISLALAYLGRDPNAVDDDSLAAAEAVLSRVRPYIRYFSNEKMIADLPNREICVAHSWSGDYAQAATRAEEAGIDIDLRYMTPKEGSALWVDGFYMPSDAPHRDAAYTFIDFMLRPDIAARNANTVFYANANRGSWPMVSRAVLDNPAIFPDEAEWRRLYRVDLVDPKRMRPRTRTFARIKSGL